MRVRTAVGVFFFIAGFAGSAWVRVDHVEVWQQAAAHRFGDRVCFAVIAIGYCGYGMATGDSAFFLWCSGQ